MLERKTRRWPRRQEVARNVVPKIATVLVPAGIGLNYLSAVSYLDKRISGDDGTLFGAFLFLFGTPFLAFLSGMRPAGKRWGALAGAAFATGCFASSVLEGHHSENAWGAELLSYVPAWLVCTAVGAGAGLLGAVTGISGQVALQQSRARKQQQGRTA